MNQTQLRTKQIRRWDYKNSCRAATNGQNIDLTSTANPGLIDGISLNDQDRVLLKDQNDPTENGLYRARVASDPSTWRRVKDAKFDEQVHGGMLVVVEEGSQNENQGFILESNDPLSLGSDDLSFSAGVGTGGGASRLFFGGDVAIRGSLKHASEIAEGDLQDNQIGIDFADNGKRFYHAFDSSEKFYQYTLAEPWDINTLVFIQSITSQAFDHACTVKEDGTKLWGSTDTGTGVGEINEYEFGTPYDLSTLTFERKLDVSAQDQGPNEVTFNNDGTKLFVAGGQSDAVHSYTLSTAYRVDTGSFHNTLDVSTELASVRGIEFLDDGTRMYITGFGDSFVYEYFLNDPFNLSTSIFVRSFEAGAFVDLANSSGLAIKPDASKLFVADENNPTFHSYKISFPYIVVNGTSDVPGSDGSIVDEEQVTQSGTINNVAISHEKDFSSQSAVVDVLVNGAVQTSQTISGGADTVDVLTGLNIDVSLGDLVSLRIRDNGGRMVGQALVE